MLHEDPLDEDADVRSHLVALGPSGLADLRDLGPDLQAVRLAADVQISDGKKGANLGRARPRLTDEQRISIAVASLENTKHLLDDSALLLAHDRLSSSAFLAVAALEETLKARYCLHQEAASWGKWWSGFRDHRAKLRMAPQLAPQASAEMLEQMVEFRERSLYVEGGHSGQPLTPRGLVDPGGLTREIILAWHPQIKAEQQAALMEIASGAVVLMPVGSTTV